MNELYIEKLIRLIDVGLINVENIKDSTYRTEVERRLSTE